MFPDRRRQEVASGMVEPSLLKPAPAASRGVLALIDVALPAKVRASPDELRRGRLFLAIWLLLTLSAFGFAYLIASSPNGIAANGVTLIIGGVLSALNLPLVHALGEMRRVSWLI